MRITNCCEQLVLAIWIKVDQLHFIDWVWLERAKHIVNQEGGLFSISSEVATPLSSTLWNIDTAQKARNNFS